MEVAFVLLFASLHLIAAVLGLVLMAHYRERRQLAYELRTAIRQFNVIAISRGRNEQ